jgi:hypothetical protein
MPRVFPRSLFRPRSLCGAWFGVLLAALLVVGSPARAAQPRLLAPAGQPGAPVEDAEGVTSEALRESRAETPRTDPPARDARRTPPAIRPLVPPFARTGAPRPNLFETGLASRLRC